MSALHSILRDRLHHAEVAVEAASRAHALALEEAAEAGLSVPDPTAQVPVSLIESAADALTLVGDMAASNELLALLSQPSPTAEPKHLPDDAERPRCAHCGRFARETGCDADHDTVTTAEPPRIEDLAPGTTFEFEGETWTVVDGGDAVRDNPAAGIRTYRSLSSRRFEPSTIRDVVVPS